MLKTFVQPANENFTTFCKKHVYESWRTLLPILLLKKWKAFAFISILSTRGRLNCAPLYLKKFEKFVQPANENFTTFCKKHVYDAKKKVNWQNTFSCPKKNPFFGRVVEGSFLSKAGPKKGCLQYLIAIIRKETSGMWKIAALFIRYDKHPFLVRR